MEFEIPFHRVPVLVSLKYTNNFRMWDQFFEPAINAEYKFKKLY